MLKLKKIVLFIQILAAFVTCRPFGSILYDIATKYNDLTVSDLRKIEKWRLKLRKAELDIRFLNTCRTFNVTPKFLTFRIPHGTSADVRAIQTRLLHSAI